MKIYTKAILLGLMISLSSTSSIYAKEMTSIESMEIKLSNLEVDITKEKLKLIKREEKLNEMKVKSQQSSKVDQNKMALKLAEIEVGLAKDKLLLSKREVKLYEMKVALLKVKQ